jgi:hypothetical protein
MDEDEDPWKASPLILADAMADVSPPGGRAIDLASDTKPPAERRLPIHLCKRLRTRDRRHELLHELLPERDDLLGLDPKLARGRDELIGLVQRGGHGPEVDVELGRRVDGEDLGAVELEDGQCHALDASVQPEFEGARQPTKRTMAPSQKNMSNTRSNV